MLGIMQGRLIPPADGRIQAFPGEQWMQEFPRAALAGIEAIEWIYDAYGLGVNPLESDEGIEQIHQCCRMHGVAVRSLCADIFMDREMLPADFIWLMGRAYRAGIQRIVLPFVDRSAIRDRAHSDAVIESLKRALSSAREYGMELHLETSLAPGDFAALLERVPDPWLKVNYDTGNSASLGYCAAEEFSAYGHRIGSVHIKDRVLGGGTTALGTGNTDFRAVFAGLRKLGYEGDFVLQAARGVEGEEVGWARQNVAFLQRWLDIRD